MSEFKRTATADWVLCNMCGKEEGRECVMKQDPRCYNWRIMANDWHLCPDCGRKAEEMERKREWEELRLVQNKKKWARLGQGGGER